MGNKPALKIFLNINNYSFNSLINVIFFVRLKYR